MKNKILKKISQIEKQNEKLEEKMQAQEIEGIKDSYFWYELQVKANEQLIEFYRKELERGVEG
jgi:hypothetical protein